MDKFPPRVAERIGWYVYALYDPGSDCEPFYIGKGKENRVFDHVHEAIRKPTKNDKLERIRDIRARGQEVRYEILRHGMEESEAVEVEATMIDFMPNLKNRVAGRHTDKRGRMSLSDIIAVYAAQPVTIEEPSILIIVNKLYRRNMKPAELYEITRGNWPLSARRNGAQYAFAVFQGVVREAYRIIPNSWKMVDVGDHALGRKAKELSEQAKNKKRWKFEGDVAENMQHYVGGSVERYLSPGAQFPIKYVKC